MNKSRKLSLINMIVNFIVIAIEATALSLYAINSSFSVNDLKFYTVLTVLVTALAAALMVWANIVSFNKKKDCTPRLFYTLRYLSAAMSFVTLVVVAAFLIPFTKEAAEGAGLSGIELITDVKSGMIFMHLICPIISVLQFIFFEIEPKGKFRKTLEPLIATLIYGIAILVTVFVINGSQGADAAAKFAPYPFFLVTQELVDAGIAAEVLKEGATVGMNIGILVSVFAIVYVLAIILWALNRLMHAIFIGEELVVAAPKAKVATKKKAAAPIKKGNAFTNYVKKKVAFTGDDSAPTGGQTYHISYHDRRLKTWKVKSENAGRALKVFPTQKEAIAFANEQVKKNGGSIRVHSMVGQIRKE